MSKRPDVPCASCGKLLYGGTTSLPAGQRTCCPCRRAAREERAADRQAHCTVGRRRGRTCLVCGKQYNATYSEQRACSRGCGVKLRHREGSYSKKLAKWPSTKVRYRDCVHCSALYVLRPGNNRIYCGVRPQCRAAIVAKRARERRRQRRQAQGPIRCGDCGEAEVAFPARKCAACLEVTAKAARRRAKGNRRARHAGATVVECIWLPIIAERDGYRCGLCRRRVNMTLKVPHSKAPTLDHIVPLTKGGDHSKANTQLAHFLCNSRKGDRVGDIQLALFG